MLGPSYRGIAVPVTHRRSRLPWPAVAAATVALFALSPPGARGHGDAEWIERDHLWRWCCGPEDCRRALPGEVQRVEDGYLILHTYQLFHDGKRGFYYHQHDHDIWLCIRGGAVICLFVPEELS